MIKAIIFGIIIAALIICAFILAYRHLVVVKPIIQERRNLRFRGGPLDGETHYADGDYPDRYTWEFTKTIASRAGKGVPPQSSKRRYEAVYVHEGDGEYTYNGRVAIDDILKQEITESVT